MPQLPAPLPGNPLPLIDQWLQDVSATASRNPLAIALSSADGTGRPSVRFVLLKYFSVTKGFIVFYTNYGSRKAAELEAAGRAAAALYCAELGRQLRFEGYIERSPPAESDAYFASRPRGSQLNAWASQQSRPIESPKALERAVEHHEAEFAGASSLARPPFWGGFRLWLAAVEFWMEGDDRFHERARYERALSAPGHSVSAAGEWHHQYLQP